MDILQLNAVDLFHFNSNAYKTVRVRSPSGPLDPLTRSRRTNYDKVVGLPARNRILWAQMRVANKC